MFSMQLKGKDAVGKLLGKTLPEETLQALKGEVKQEARAIQAIGKANAPVATGQLESDVRIKYSARGLNAVVGVFSPARGYIARFLEFGVKPHEIKPRNARALAWGGQVVKSVMHPGIRPMGWLLGATFGRRKQFESSIRQAVTEVLRKVKA